MPTPGTVKQATNKTGTFKLTGSMSTQRSLHTATSLANGRVLIAGGYDKTMATLSSAEIYDPLTGRFQPSSP